MTSWRGDEVAEPQPKPCVTCGRSIPPLQGGWVAGVGPYCLGCLPHDPDPRHAARQANDALGRVVIDYPGWFTPEERDMVGRLRHALDQIADGIREDT
jgi:hypothetical protein